MPKKATKSQAKSKSQERREKVQREAAAHDDDTVVTYSAADARAAYNNGKIVDREIVALKYPDGHVPMVGFCAFVRGECFTRQAEMPSDDEKAVALGEKQYDDLVAFLKTVKDPE